MHQSEYTQKYHTSSFYIGLIRAAVEEFQGKHGGLGSIEVNVTHISDDDFTAQGHAESRLDGVIVEVERIAKRKLEERSNRRIREAQLRNYLATGVITEEEFDREYIFLY